MNTQTTVDKATPALVTTILLHLIPGAVGTLFYILAVPVVTSLGYPPLLAIYSAIIIIVAIELGYLVYHARTTRQKFFSAEVVTNRERIPAWQYVAFVLAFVVWATIASGILSLVDNFLATTVFAKLPDWYLFKDVINYPTLYSKSALMLTFIVAIILNGLIGPIVEELYFRGHLLPRLSSLGRGAPWVNVILFSLYHFWAPWQFVSRIFVVFPWTYFAQKKQNIYVGMITHSILNLISVLVTFAVLLK